MSQDRVAIIGAGPAGLTAAYLLSKQQAPVTVLEADPVYVGGISRTVKYKGYHFDIGGHRFFSKSKEVEDLWTEILPDDMLERPRSSRIYYRGQFFSYPLKAGEALQAIEAALDWAQHRRQESTLALKDARHVPTQRLHEQGDHHAIEGDLDPAVESHGGVSLEARPARSVPVAAERRRDR